MAERERNAGKRVATILCGGNLDAHLLTQILAGHTPQVS
jgi:threonine dehydratase